MKKLLALLLALTMVLSLAACGEKTEEAPKEPLQEELPEEKEETPDAEPEAPAEEEELPTEETPEEQPEETPEEEPELPELSGIAGEADGYWYEVDAGSATYTDNVGNELTYTYAIPAFNVDSADASAMNADIESVCSGYVEEMKQAEAEGYSLMTYEVAYEAYQNANIVSILVKVRMEADVVLYYTYNLDVSTGTRATGADLVAAVGMTEDGFIEAAQQVTSAKFEEMYGMLKGDASMGAMYDEQYAKTMSADAFSMTTPMFLNGSGKLCMVARIYAMAGASYYDYILEVA